MSAPPEFRTFGMKEMETVPDDRHFVAPDIISCIFVLSALPPGKQIPALRSLLSVRGIDLVWPKDSSDF